jgi:hypothetical protein
MSQSSRIRIASYVAVAALVAGTVAGCSSPGSAAPSASAAAPASASASGPADVAALQAFAALPPAEQEAQLQALTASLDRQLMTMSGLEQELGGAAKADAAYAALTASVRQFAQNLVDKPDFGRFGAPVPAEDPPTIGGMMFGNFMIGSLMQEAAVSAAKDIAPGDGAQQSQSLGDAPSGGKGSVSADGDLSRSSVGVDGEFTVDGITGKLKTIVTVSPCPDAKGEFTSTTNMTASVTSAGGGTGSNLSIEMTIKGQVDDNAELVSYDTDTRTQSAKFEGGKGQFVDLTVGWTVAGKDWTSTRGKINRTGGNVTDQFATEQGKWSTFTAIMLQGKAVDAAKQAWQSGRCVALKPTTQPSKRTALSPSSSLTISAAPRSKVDGGPVGGTVTATLTGDTSVSPAGSKVPADATFTYVAPGEKDKSATVSLEARSKRGVAKADVNFDTKQSAYEISGTIPSVPSGITVTGKTCDVTKPFTASTTGDAVGAFTFTPSDDQSGKAVFKGKVGNAPLKMSGGGSYTISAAPDGSASTLDFTWKSTIHIPVVGNQTRSGPVSLTLTPIAPC